MLRTVYHHLGGSWKWAREGSSFAASLFYNSISGVVLAVYIGFFRLNHIRFVAKDPMLTRLLKVWELPVQSTFWRFLASLHLSVAQQLL